MVDHLPLAAPLLDDPLQVITDPAGWVQGWLWAAIFGRDQVQDQSWVGVLFSRAFYFTGLDAADCDGGAGGSCSYLAIWSALQTTGYLVLAMALMLRLLRVLFDARRQTGVAQWLVTDVLIRGSLGVAAINVSYATLAMLMHSSIVLGAALFDSIMSVTLSGFAGPQGLQNAITLLLTPANLPIPLILETIVMLYLTALLVASRIAMLFAIAVAPLVIPLWAYSGESSLIVWWLRIVGQGLLVPIVMGALFGVALVVVNAVNGIEPGALAPLLGTVTAVVALWFVGHSIHQLLRFLFPGHQGFFAGVVLWHGRAGFVGARAVSAVRTVTSPARLVRR